MLCWAWTLGSGALGHCPRPLWAAMALERSHKPGRRSGNRQSVPWSEGSGHAELENFNIGHCEQNQKKAIYAFVQEEILQMWDFYFLIFIYYF